MTDLTRSAEEVRIERAVSRDLDSVMTIMNSAFDPRFGEGWTRSQCAGILPMAGVCLNLARLGDLSPTGFSLYRTVSDEAELLLLAVVPQLRRRGIGRTLLDHFIDQARTFGASRAHLEVREGNPAVAMYRKAGFRPVGRRHKYYRGSDGSHYDAVTLAIDL